MFESPRRHHHPISGTSRTSLHSVSNRRYLTEFVQFFYPFAPRLASHSGALRIIEFHARVGKLLGKIFASRGFPNTLSYSKLSDLKCRKTSATDARLKLADGQGPLPACLPERQKALAHQRTHNVNRSRFASLCGHLPDSFRDLRVHSLFVEVDENVAVAAARCSPAPSTNRATHPRCDRRPRSSRSSVVLARQDFILSAYRPVRGRHSPRPSDL